MFGFLGTKPSISIVLDPVAFRPPPTASPSPTPSVASRPPPTPSPSPTPFVASRPRPTPSPLPTPSVLAAPPAEPASRPGFDQTSALQPPESEDPNALTVDTEPASRPGFDQTSALQPPESEDPKALTVDKASTASSHRASLDSRHSKSFDSTRSDHKDAWSTGTESSSASPSRDESTDASGTSSPAPESSSPLPPLPLIVVSRPKTPPPPRPPSTTPDPTPCRILTGKLIVTLPRKTTRLASLHLSFTGYLLLDRHALLHHPEASSSKPQLIYTLFKSNILIWNGGHDGATLGGTTHAFPFQIPLPAKSMVPASMQTRHAQVVYNITATLKRFPPPLSASRLKAGFPPMPPVEFLSVTKPLFLARQGRVVPQTTGTQMQVLSVSLDLEGGEGRLMMGRKRNSKDLGEQMKSKLSIRMSTGSTSPSQIFTFEAVSPREVGVNNAATLSPSPSPTPSAGGNSPNSSAPHTLKILLKLQIAKPNHVWDVRSVTCTVVERKTYILPGDGSVRRTSGVLAPDRGAGGTVGAYRPPPPPARHVVLDDVVGEPVEYIVAAGARGRDAAAAGGGGGGGGTGSLKPKRGRFSRNSHMPAASLPQQHLQQARRSLSVEESMPVNELFVMTFSVGVDTSRVTPDLELKQLQIRHVLKFEVAYSGDGSGVGSTVEVVEVPIGMNAAES